MTLASVPRYDPDAIPAVGDHAVVVGASVAGMVAARVLDDAFDRVTVLDRDPLPDDASARRGVPQSRQPHVLLEAGRATLEDLFPGYGEMLVESGGLMLDWTTDLTYYQQGGVLATGPQPKVLYSASRPLFEHAIRQRLAARDGITFRGETQFVDYLADGTNDVAGVEIREGDGTESLRADLVVDATGRTSSTPSWLEAHGYDAPPVDELTVDVAYTTAVVERPPDDRRAYFVPPSPQQPRGGGVFPVEGDRWLVMLQGVHGDDPPTDIDALREFARTLPIDDFAELLETRPVVGDIAHYPFPSNRRRRYEALDEFPDGLVVLGDAVASFNPVYGQGMSVACLEAVLLGHALADGTDDLPRRFFDSASDVVDVAWLLATTADLAFDDTEGSRSLPTRLFDRYASRVVDTAHEDGEVSSTYGRVLSMEVPPTALLRPGVAVRVLRP
ncbi:FAD-dependent oxidoreductase [Halobacterium noricense]|uniref:FAD-dependent oxidoreductase n=1 Tax=Halobacterium noricense TaxID=223182 RepID=UPI001E31F881|nr:FAD-dependent monooxygenase [Halobacterium noricense]UHH24828.1 FAD-dependent monooxygenase [Halobacterium noricense]